jgi:hypothetical protein
VLKRRVGGVRDGIDVELGDVRLDYLDLGDFAPLFMSGQLRGAMVI